MKISQLEIPNLILCSRLESWLRHMVLISVNVFFFFFKESELNSLSGQVAQVRCFYPFETGVNYLPIHYFNGHIVLFKWNLCKGNA